MRAAMPCLQFHEAPLAESGIQTERTPHEQRRSGNAERQAEPRIESGHIEHDDEDEESQQSAGEEEEVLAF